MRLAHLVPTALLLAILPPSVHAAPCAGFTDVQDTSAFCANVTWLRNRAITLGCISTTLYCPDDLVTRLQMAAFLNRLADNAVFQRDGNAWDAKAVLGTKDFQPVEFIVDGSRVMRYEPTGLSPNVIGGNPANHVIEDVRGATIAGGGGGGTASNRVTDHYGTVGGGRANRAGDAVGTLDDGSTATVGGGEASTASGSASVVSGG